jgi:hypothetical protein
MDLKAYAEVSGKAQTTMRNKLMAWRVAAESHVGFEKVRDCWRNLAEIHAAPEWLWPALVCRQPPVQLHHPRQPPAAVYAPSIRIRLE